MSKTSEGIDVRGRTYRLLAGAVLAGLLAGACTSAEPVEEAEGEDAAAGGASEVATDATDASTAGTSDVTAPAAGAGETLAGVQDRGALRCGVNGQLEGFSFNDGGTYTGFDVDFCRAIAAAIFDDPEAVEYVDLTAETRFTALQSGDIDVLIRNGTWTASRDGELGLQWTQTTFYDGQGLLVRADSAFQTIEDLANATICVQTGTTTELNLASTFNGAGIPYTPLLLPDEDAVAPAFQAQQCDAYTTDRSGLASFRTSFPDGPEAVRILEEVISKEPLGPAVREGDDKWYDLVNWVVFATMQAEEFGLTSENIAGAAEDPEFAENPEVLRFLAAGEGDDASFASGLDLEPDFAVRVVSSVGNYAEIYERNIAPLGLDRGLNALYNADEPGILYPPPYR